MSLEAISTIIAPAQSTIDIDPSVHIMATNPDGTLIISESTGKPITIAQDRRTGNWYALAADSFPFFGTKKAKEGLQDLIDAGGVHVPHDDQRFRGVWVPIAEAVDQDYETTDSTDQELTDGDAKPAPARRPVPVKKPKKKANG